MTADDERQATSANDMYNTMRSFALCIQLSVIFRTTAHAFVVAPPLGASSSLKRHCTSTSLASAKPKAGQIVTIDCSLEPENDFVPEPLFDTHGKLMFVLHQGNYLPGLHDLVSTMTVGEKVEGVSLDAGWGERNENLVAKIPLKDLEQQGMDVSELQVGVKLQMANGLRCVIAERNEESITIDANPPLAGASYSATVELLNIEDGPSELEYTEDSSDNKYQVATFALGCFWGGELKMARQIGVVGTSVGFTQGKTENPTYEQVCSGTTGHTEAIQVIFDETVISYEKLVHICMDNLGENKYLKNQVGNDVGTQYRHGIYYHNPKQRDVAQVIIESFGEDCVTECLPATKFYRAEDYHQQYLLKGGQSARKGEDSVIRCYG